MDFIILFKKVYEHCIKHKLSVFNIAFDITFPEVRFIDIHFEDDVLNRHSPEFEKQHYHELKQWYYCMIILQNEYQFQHRFFIEEKSTTHFRVEIKRILRFQIIEED